MKQLLVNEDVCMGCGLCVVYCKVQHSTSKDILKAHRESPPALSRIRVEENRPSSFPVQCQHCEDPPCVASCLSGALYVDEETRLVKHTLDKCTGCWTCIMVCPYGAITMDVLNRKVVKCDLCPGLDIPACVTYCPNEAITYQEVTST